VLFCCSDIEFKVSFSCEFPLLQERMMDNDIIIIIKKNILFSMFIAVFVVSTLIGNITAYAYSDTNRESAYSSYYKKNLADIECRIWLSTGDIGYHKVNVDATSSSWVFDKMDGISIKDHQNTMKLNKTGVGVNLNVSASPGATVTKDDGNIFSERTSYSTSYYRGLNIYNALLKFDFIGVKAASITATSSQSLKLDGQGFVNQADTTGYYTCII